MTVDYAAMRARADGCRPGPWFARENDVIGGWCVMPFDVPPSTEGVFEVADFSGPEDAEFIAHARTDLPALLDVRDAALEVLAAYDRSGGAAVLKEWEGADWIEEIRAVLEGGAP